MNSRQAHSYHPDYAIAPGETLRQQIEAINLSQAGLASRSGLSAKHVNQIMQGIAPITHETALVLERVTGLPAGLWNRLESDYRETQLRKRQRELSADDQAWLETLPIKDLQKRGRIPATGDTSRLYEALLAFFGVADHEAWERVWLRPIASFKRSKAFRSDPGAVATWLRLGQLDVRGVKTADYDASMFRAALTDARRLTRAGDFSDDLKDLCASAGVAVVYMPEIGKSRVSGAAWWATPNRAVIQLSDRYKHDDNFWFAFFHEAGHILLHSKKETFIDDGPDHSEIETEANRFAANALIPPARARELATLWTDADVNEFAASVGVSPGIVVGRLHNDRHWDWRKGNRLRRRLQIVEG